jgi:Uma2 family endonuclease
MDSIDELDFSITYTYADYYSWRFEERVELIKGKIFRMSPAPSNIHQDIALNIASELRSFLKDKSCKVYISPFDVRLVREEKTDKKIKTVVQPDVCVVCDQSKLTDQRGCLGPPDIVVEVLLPGNNTKELKIKYDLYEEFGVKEYWVVYPGELSLVRYVLNKDGKFISTGRAFMPGDKITTEVLPGFELALDDVFSGL